MLVFIPENCQVLQISLAASLSSTALNPSAAHSAYLLGQAKSSLDTGRHPLVVKPSQIKTHALGWLSLVSRHPLPLGGCG